MVQQQQITEANTWKTRTTTKTKKECKIRRRQASNAL